MLTKKKYIFNKPTVEGLDSVFIIHIAENSEVMNPTTANESVNSDSNITPDINESSSKYSKQNKTHANNIEKENAIHNSASENENLSANSSIISDNNPANSENTLLIDCAECSLNGNTIKNSAKILEKIIPCFWRNINTPILEKHDQLNTELQALKNCILKVEAQMYTLKSDVKCQLSSLAK